MSPIERSAGGGGGGATPSLASDRKTLTTGDFTWTATTFTDLNAALDITLTTGAHRCLCAWTLMAKNSDGTGPPQLQVDVELDGTRLGQTFGLVFFGPNANNNVNLSGSTLTSVLTAASHTFKLMFRIDGNHGTTSIYASTTIAPIIFNVVELYA